MFSVCSASTGATTSGGSLAKSVAASIVCSHKQRNILLCDEGRELTGVSERLVVALLCSSQKVCG